MASKKKQPSTETVEAPTKEHRMSEINVMELDLNLDEYQDYELLPSRNYTAEIRKAESKIADSGSEYYKVQFRIDPDDYPADYDVENAPEGTILSHSRLFKPDPKDRRSITAMKKWYKTIGLPLKTSVIDPSLWEGKKVKLNVGKSTFNGEERNEIKGIEALD